MLPPVVSLANNGDFGKVVGHFSLGSPFALEWDFAPLKFHFDPAFTYHAEFRSSETLLAACAIGLSSVISKSGEVDIRTIGLIHGGIFLLAMYLLIPVLGCFFGPKTRFAILVAIAATFCDVMYVSLFNSFYMDASALVFLLLTVVLFLRSWLWKRPADLIGFVISSLFLVTAKPQHVLMVIPMVVLIICYRKLCTVRGAPWVAAGVLTIATCWTAFSLPSDYTRNSIYTVIYIGLLPDSPSPADEMREFQLDAPTPHLSIPRHFHRMAVSPIQRSSRDSRNGFTGVRCCDSICGIRRGHSNCFCGLWTTRVKCGQEAGTSIPAKGILPAR